MTCVSDIAIDIAIDIAGHISSNISSDIGAVITNDTYVYINCPVWLSRKALCNFHDHLQLQLAGFELNSLF